MKQIRYISFPSLHVFILTEKACYLSVGASKFSKDNLPQQADIQTLFVG
jgi:hypothetical protein